MSIYRRMLDDLEIYFAYVNQFYSRDNKFERFEKV